MNIKRVWGSGCEPESGGRRSARYVVGLVPTRSGGAAVGWVSSPSPLRYRDLLEVVTRIESDRW